MDYFLTTPLMQDGKKGVTGVKRLQKLLAGGGVFKEDYAPGKIDGQFGERTARAVKRAKYWLGYRDALLNEQAGEPFVALLSGEAKLSVAQRARRSRRKKNPPKLKVVALELHRDHVGETEDPPNSNRSWASRTYGLIGAWCAMACSVVGVQAGSKQTFRLGAFYAYVPFLEADARRGIRKLAVVGMDEVAAGDLVTFDWDVPRNAKGGGTGDHIEQFDKWLDATKGRFQTIGSNTSFEGSSGSQSDGGATAVRTRFVRDVNYFVRWSE